MRHLKIIIYILIPFLLLSSCIGSKNVSKDSTSFSDEEFVYNSYLLEGLRCKTIGLMDQALANYEKARELNPKSPVIHYQLAEVNAQLGNLQAAIHYAEQAVNLDKDNLWYHVLLVQLYQNSNLIAKAATELEEIVRLKPEQIEFYFMLSGIYQSIGQPKESIKILNKAEKQFGIMDVISIEKETIYLAEKQNSKAIAEVEKLIKAFPSETKYQALLAELYINIDQLNKAKEIYDKIYLEEDIDGRVLLAMSSYYWQTKETEKAFGLLKRAFADENLSVDLKVEMILAILMKSNANVSYIAKETEIMNILIETHPNDPKVLTVYSDYLVKRGKFTEAQQALISVVKIVKDKYVLWEQLLYIDNELIDFPGMFSHSSEAIELFPLQPMPYVFNCLSGLQLNESETVIKNAKIGLEILPEDNEMKIDMITFLGEAYHKLERYNEADSVFDHILNLEPENEHILNNYAYYLSLRKEKLDKAQKLGEKLISLFPEEPTYLDTYGWVLYQMGKYEDAKHYLRKALDNGGNSAEIIEHYGDVLFKLGEKDQAIPYWERALKLVPDNEKLKSKIKTKELQ